MIARGKLGKTVAYIVVFLGALWTALPLYWMVITSVKSRDEVWTYPPTFFPQEFSTEGFVEAWTHGGARGIKDSAIIAVGTLIVSLSLGVPAAYSIARHKTGGDNLSFTVLSFRFMPPIAPAVGFWIFATRLGLFDTHFMLILVNSMASIPFVVWIMKGFIEEIPYGIEEAAQVDGASWGRIARDHVLPLAAPGVVAVDKGEGHQYGAYPLPLQARRYGVQEEPGGIPLIRVAVEEGDGLAIAGEHEEDEATVPRSLQELLRGVLELRPELLVVYPLDDPGELFSQL